MKSEFQKETTPNERKRKERPLFKLGVSINIAIIVLQESRMICNIYNFKIDFVLEYLTNNRKKRELFE